jgi:hypothetical protein
MPTSFQFFKQEVRDYIVDNVEKNIEKIKEFIETL